MPSTNLPPLPSLSPPVTIRTKGKGKGGTGGEAPCPAPKPAAQTSTQERDSPDVFEECIEQSDEVPSSHHQAAGGGSKVCLLKC